MSDTNATQDSNEIDDIISELKDSCAPSKNSRDFDVVVPKVNDENVGDFIYQKGAEAIEMGLAALRDMQAMIKGGNDPKEVTAYATLMGTVLRGIDNVNKINLQQKQAKNNIEVKKLDVEAKKKSGGLVPELTNGTQTNNIFIGSRDEALKHFNNTRTVKTIELLQNEIVEEGEE